MKILRAAGIELQVLDVMSVGVALAWATEAFERNVYSEERLASVGYPRLAESVVVRSRDVQAKRWQPQYQKNVANRQTQIKRSEFLISVVRTYCLEKNQVGLLKKLRGM